MNHEELEALRKRYGAAETLRKNIDNTHGLINGIKRRLAKGSSPYNISVQRKCDDYNSTIYLTVPEPVIAALLPALKSVLDKMREDFKGMK